MLRWFLFLTAALTACSSETATVNAEASPDNFAVAAANGSAPDGTTDVPLADRPAPEPIVGGPPLEGEFDPDIMTVTLAGDRLAVQDAKHAWPLHLDDSTYDFARNSLASFGTPSRQEGPSDCPAGKLTFLDYPNGLQLAFQDGKLVGYWVKGAARGIATESGITVGSSRSALGKREVDEASFGKLVDVDGTIAVLDGQGAKVTDLYAGAACIYG